MQRIDRIGRNLRSAIDTRCGCRVGPLRCADVVDAHQHARPEIEEAAAAIGFVAQHATRRAAVATPTLIVSPTATPSAGNRRESSHTSPAAGSSWTTAAGTERRLRDPQDAAQRITIADRFDRNELIAIAGKHHRRKRHACARSRGPARSAAASNSSGIASRRRDHAIGGEIRRRLRQQRGGQPIDEQADAGDRADREQHRGHEQSQLAGAPVTQQKPQHERNRTRRADLRIALRRSRGAGPHRDDLAGVEFDHAVATIGELIVVRHQHQRRRRMRRSVRTADR